LIAFCACDRYAFVTGRPPREQIGGKDDENKADHGRNFFIGYQDAWNKGCRGLALSAVLPYNKKTEFEVLT